MSKLAEGVKLVAKMTALRDDGAPVAVAWLKFPEEPDSEATAYEVRKGGQLVPLGWKFETWRALFEAFAP